MILSCLLSIDTISGFVPVIDEQQTRITGSKSGDHCTAKSTALLRQVLLNARVCKTSISFVS